MNFLPSNTTSISDQPIIDLSVATIESATIPAMIVTWSELDPVENRYVKYFGRYSYNVANAAIVIEIAGRVSSCNFTSNISMVGSNMFSNSAASPFPSVGVLFSAVKNYDADTPATSIGLFLTGTLALLRMISGISLN